MKLIVGAGNRHTDGFTHHDIQPLKGIDIVCEFWDLPKHVESESCEEIHMTHVLEHFPIVETCGVLELLHDLLKPQGKLYIEVPNFYWHALKILENPRDRQIVEYAFGGQLNKWDFHYNGFTPENLVEDLMNAGFEVTEFRPNSSIECWSWKAGIKK
jgi:predicted SAM-dependent methyltransferase